MFVLNYWRNQELLGVVINIRASYLGSIIDEGQTHASTTPPFNVLGQ